MAMDITAKAPVRRNFHLRSDPLSSVTTTPPSHLNDRQKQSKRSRLSRLFHSSSSSLTPTFLSKPTEPPTAEQFSPLLTLPTHVLDKITFHALSLPQKLSVNFPYSPLPTGCASHLPQTNPPALFRTCKALRASAQRVFFEHTTFASSFLAGGPTAHFWLKHDWSGSFVGPAAHVKSVLARAEKVEVVVVVPSLDPAITTEDLHGKVRVAVEKDDTEAVRKCLAVYLAYVQGMKVGKGASRGMEKQISSNSKSGGIGVLRASERDGIKRAPLKSLRVVLSKRDPRMVVTGEIFHIMDMLGELKVEGEVEIVLECRNTEHSNTLRLKRDYNGPNGAIDSDWPDREETLAYLQTIGQADPTIARLESVQGEDYAGRDARVRGGWWWAT